MEQKFCKRLPVCPFFRAVQESEEILDVLTEYVQVYCCGPLQAKCFRIIHFDNYGTQPADDISPSGLNFRKYLNLKDA
ncbi:MAG TPA: hypothetical protein VGA63_09900 [Geopsychrobacteraceae bacterium]|jgi:hypothetical protein